MNCLIILNGPPNGAGRSYNGLRLANPLAEDEQAEVSVFLMGDAVACAAAGQATPNGFYNIKRMLKMISSKGGKIGVCGSCMDARGLKPDGLVPAAHRGSMQELTAWTKDADKVLVC